MPELFRSEFDQKFGIHPIIETLGGLDVTQIFVHSVTSLRNITEIAPTAHVYPERALICARSDDLVCLAVQVDKKYLQYLHDLGMGPKVDRIVVALETVQAKPSASLSDLLMGNRKALYTIRGLLQGHKKLILNPFIASPKEFRLAAALETLIGSRVCLLGGNAEIVDYANRKHHIRRKAIELGVPVAEGEIVETQLRQIGKTHELTALREVTDKFIQKNGTVIIKGTYGNSGSSIFIVRNTVESIHGVFCEIADRDSNHIYVVEEMLDLTVSPNIMIYIEPESGDITCVSITDQIFGDGLKHEGNIYPSTAKTIEEMLVSARRMSVWLKDKGYTGFVGFDFGEYLNSKTGRPEHFLCEINPRINGALYPKVLMERLNRKQATNGNPSIEAFVAKIFETKTTSFPELQKTCGRLFFRPETGKGIVPYVLGRLMEGKVLVAIFGKTRNEVLELLESVKAILV
jgi:Pre ATP-grasp domain